MAIIDHDRVWETVVVTGTGDITLPGTPAAVGARTFVSVYNNGDGCTYMVADGTTGDWESGVATVSVSAGVATLARTVVVESTNSNAAVSFAGNSCSVLVAKLPGVQTSAGSASAGSPTILGPGGVLDASLVPASGGGEPLLSVPPSGTVTLAWPAELVGFGTGYPVHQAGFYQRVMVRWPFAGDPVALGGWVNSVTPPANFRLGAYEILTSGKAGALLYDSGEISVSATGINMGAVVAAGIALPGTFFLDIIVDQTSNLGWFYCNPGPIGMVDNFINHYPMYSGGGATPATPFPNPCNYDSSPRNSYESIAPIIGAQF